jgi:hypothetical protein
MSSRSTRRSEKRATALHAWNLGSDSAKVIPVSTMNSGMWKR